MRVCFVFFLVLAVSVASGCGTTAMDSLSKKPGVLDQTYHARGTRDISQRISYPRLRAEVAIPREARLCRTSGA